MDNGQKDLVLLKGNEVIAKAAIRYGYDGFFGYPITPQSEVLETLAVDKPWETTGMVVLQAESELASINMLYGAGCTGKLVFTSSSSPGIALMQEGISYMAGNELPGVIVSVGRGGPGLGTIQPGQADYYQAVYGGGNGDYHTIVLAPNSVQEMSDCMGKAAELTFKWRMPVIVLSDGMLGQMMETVELPPYRPRRTEEEIGKQCPWATNGIGLKNRKYNFMSTLEFDPQVMEDRNLKMAAKASGNKSCALIHMKELLPTTGYIRGGCSPIGMKKTFPTFIHSTCLDLDKMYVSAGIRGLQICLAPSDLVRMTKATVCSLF